MKDMTVNNGVPIVLTKPNPRTVVTNLIVKSGSVYILTILTEDFFLSIQYVKRKLAMSCKKKIQEIATLDKEKYS